MTVELYRARFGAKFGGNTDWRYYENKKERFLVDLLEAHLGLMYNERAGSDERWGRMMFAARWLDKMFPGSSRYNVIYAVQKMVDGEWVDLTVDFVEPKVTVNL